MSKITSAQINAFVRDIDGLAGKAAGLQEKLATFIEDCGNVVEFRKELYTAAKAKSERAYATTRQLFSRTCKALGVETGETRGKTAKASSKAKTAKPAKVEEKKVVGMTDALAIARVGELAHAFLTADDQAIFARMLSAIDHNRKKATTAKK